MSDIIGQKLTFLKLEECLKRAYSFKKPVEDLQAELWLLKQVGRRESAFSFYHRVSMKLEEMISAIPKNSKATEEIE